MVEAEEDWGGGEDGCEGGNCGGIGVGGAEDDTADGSWKSAGELVDGEFMAYRLLMVPDRLRSDAPTYAR